MKERMQKISTQSDNWLENNRTASEGYRGVQTFIGITKNNLTEVPFTQDELLEQILSPSNLNRAYKEVLSNKGRGGINGLETDELLPWLLLHKEELIHSLESGKYRPHPVRRVEIPKDGGKKRLLGIPTVVDRLVQQSIAQVLLPLYEREFSNSSFGFRPKRSCHDALRCAQSHVNAGHKYVVDLDLEKFFDTVNHSRLIELLSKRIKDGRVVSLIHKYLLAGVMIGIEIEHTRQGVPQGGAIESFVEQHYAQ